jgi:OOP family OmpA-OmpF porin
MSRIASRRKTGLVTLLGLTALIAFGPMTARALDRSSFDELSQLMDSARLAEAPIFAPATWEKADKAFQKAEADLAAGKKQKTLDEHVAEALEYVQNAMKAAEVAKLSLQEHLPPRDKARTARAPTLVPELYATAEEQFVKATAKVESGDVKGALKEAEKAKPLFSNAELEAIRVDILGLADRLIAKALADDAEKYAPSTLDKARGARQHADALLVGNRYDRETAVAEARRAEYEARHASNIGLSVRSLNRNDQAWEKLMLVYEIQMDRVGKTFGLENLPFDEGPLAAADTLIARIEALQLDQRRFASQLAGVSDKLALCVTRLDLTPAGNDPLKLASQLETRVGELSQKLQTGQAQLAQLAEEHEAVAGELEKRRAREQRFRAAKSVLSPAEGEVLYNAANDVVLRLPGLAFGVGRSDITEEQVPLLEKIRQILGMFPNARLVIEGHTDNSGDPQANQQLSEKRAFAIMQYLRQSMMVPVDRIQAMGYGAEHPVGSNMTADGRAKNRRIDIIIME